MSNSQKIPWNRISVEAAAIVASILLAFAIDAWWEDAQSERQEAQILDALLQDLVSRREIIESQRIYINAIRDSANILLYASAEGNESLGSTSVDELISDVWWINQPARWSFPLLSSIVAGDQLALISNVRLRTMLVDWLERFGNIQAAVARDLAFYDERLIPFLDSNVSMPQILNAVRHTPGFPNQAFEFGQRFSLKMKTDHTDLLASKEFQGIIARRSILLNDILVQITPDFAADLDRFIEVIRAELQ